jgi:hypothetical protein
MDAKQLQGALESFRYNDYVTQRLLQQTADGRYGWLPHLVKGARLKHTLAADELKKQELRFEPELTTALFPTRVYHEVVEPCECLLANETRVTLTLEPMTQSSWFPAWGTRAEKNFWEWLKTQHARAGDALVFQIESALPPRCTVFFQPENARDTACEEERNNRLAETTFTLLKPRQNGLRLPDIAARLLAHGLYHKPCAPDALAARLPQDPRFRLDRYYWKIATRADRQYLALGLEHDDLFDLFGEAQKRPKHKHPPKKELAAKVYRILASFRHNKGLWRRIEICGDQELWQFDEIMRAAFGHDASDHLSEFYLGTDAEAHHRGLGAHNPFEGGGGADWLIGELGLEPGDTLSYTYDFGDNIQHVLKVEAIGLRERGIEYPRVVEQNKARHRYCRDCRAEGKKEIATWFCIDCSNEEQRQVLVCEEHAQSEHEDHYTEEIVY